jgi:hypothetical protein
MYHKENLALISQMNHLAPDVMKAFWAFDKAAVAEGAIPVKIQGTHRDRCRTHDPMSVLHRHSHWECTPGWRERWRVDRGRNGRRRAARRRRGDSRDSRAVHKGVMNSTRLLKNGRTF